MRSTSPSVTEPLQLLDLPNELLLLILANLPPAALLYLATLCRRLHYLSLPIYFASFGMDDPTQHADVLILNAGQDALSALQMALFIPSVEKLSCSFPHYNSSLAPITRHIRRLRTLVERLEFVHDVTIVWDTAESVAAVSADGLEELALEMERLLNTIISRDCSLLAVRYGVFFSHAYDLRLTRGIGVPLGAVRDVVRQILTRSPSSKAVLNDGLKTYQSKGDADVISMELDAEGCSSSMLAHLKIHSSMFLLPPCLNWSLSALRSSPITCLELSGIVLPTAAWAAVLPIIATLVPNLTHLTMSQLYGIAGSDILSFLAKLHLRIKSVIIGYTEYSRHVQSSCPDSGTAPRFQQLTHLHAPSTFILHFLKNKSSLLNLTWLCITPRNLILGFRGMRHIGQLVFDIVRALEKRKLAPTVSLELHCGRGAEREMVADLAQAPEEAVVRCLKTITHLIVHLQLEGDSDILVGPELGTLARWIARFPGLVHVSLRVRGRGAREFSGADTDDWATAENARTISEQNPNVKSLELNGKVFDYANTLSILAREAPPHIGF